MADNPDSKTEPLKPLRSPSFGGAPVERSGTDDDPDASGAAGAMAGSAVGAGAGKAAAVEAGQTLDLGLVTDASPDAAVQKSGVLMSGLQCAGVDLAHVVLGIIAVALVVLTALVMTSEIWPTSDVTELHKLVLSIHGKSVGLPADHAALPAIRKDLQDLTRQIVDAKQAQRAFWMQFSQMVLLNLLLPVLTAILGYVFGANANKQ